jgi:hypothetical protein
VKLPKTQVSRASRLRETQAEVDHSIGQRSRVAGTPSLLPTFSDEQVEGSVQRSQIAAGILIEDLDQMDVTLRCYDMNQTGYK